MELLGPAPPRVADHPVDQLGAGRGRETVPGRPDLLVEPVRRDADTCLLTMSGDLSRGSAEVAGRAVAAALRETGRVLVDVSGLRPRWGPAVQVFASALAAAGGWPAARLVLVGAGAHLAESLVSWGVPAAVPVAPDEATARRLLLRRPPTVSRHIDLAEESDSPRRARRFVAEAARDWGLDVVRDDAVLVANELVANAVAHARTPCRLDVRLDALGLTVAVRDGDFRGLLVPLAFGTAGHRDHGLFLVSSISRTWGINPTENGKSVWALLPVPER